LPTVNVSGIAIDFAVVRSTLIAVLAAIVALSIVRRHSERWARQRARRALGETERERGSS